MTKSQIKKMLYGCPDVLWYIRTAIQHPFSIILFLFLFLCGAYFCAERSPALGQEVVGQEVVGQEALEQEALLWFLQSPGVPYVISL